MILMYWWARNYPVTDAASKAEVTEVSACSVYQSEWLRKCVPLVCRLSTPIRSSAVQIDKKACLDITKGKK